MPTRLRKLDEGRYDAIILDVMLPRLSGHQVVRQLRARQVWTPVLILSAKDGDYDQADGLDEGADDYLTKPFSFVVLVARLRALLRRGAQPRPAVLRAGPLSLDPATRRFLRVTIVDGAETDRVLGELMGKDVEARFRFIMERSAQADLDI